MRPETKCAVVLRCVGGRAAESGGPSRVVSGGGQACTAHVDVGALGGTDQLRRAQDSLLGYGLDVGP